MKKRVNALLVSAIIFGLVMSLFGMTSVSQTALANKKNQNWHRQAPAPVHATNIKVIKKVLLPEDIRGTKGKPSSPPGLSKKEGAATGTLGEQVTGNKYAIVIGIGDYPGTDYDLYESDGDSLHMYKALTTLYGYNPDNIYLFKDMGGITGSKLDNKVYGKPTRDAIYNAIMDIKSRATSTDEVVFFFSGHGTKGNYSDDNATDTANGVDLDGIDEAIAVHDSDEEMDEDGYSDLDFIWDGELRDWFSGFATSRIAFVFDSCLAGGMNDVAADGRVISMATDETHSAYVYSTASEDVDGDGVEDGESVFTRLFANEGMLQGLANIHDYDGDETLYESEQVTVEEAFDYAKDNIPPYLKQRQKPVISDKFKDDLLL